jgi:RNA polymerase sigma-B factor
MTLISGRAIYQRFDESELDALAVRYVEQVAGLPAGAAERRARRANFVCAAVPLATRLAHRYRGRGEPIEDLEQVARIGLIKAIDRYDPKQGRFSAFAAITILGELRRHFRDRTWDVRVPRRMQELSRAVGRADMELTAELRRSPTVAELADHLSINQGEVLAAQESSAAYAAVSLHALPGGTGVGLADRLAEVDPGLDRVEDRVTVSGLLYRLPARERRILALRFYGNRTQAEIAAELGMSQMHVSRLLSRALTWLREAMLSEAPQHWRAGPILPDGHRVTLFTRIAGGRAIVEVTGEVDRDTAGRLRDGLLHAVRLPVREVLAELSGVPFVDAAGIAAVLVALEAARGAEVRLRIGGTQPYVRRALRVAGLGAVLEECPAAGAQANGSSSR